MYKTSLYRISSDKLVGLRGTSLGARESALQQWIWEDPTLLGEPLALLGREVPTAYGKRIDLLAIDERQNICILELKRDRTPREVVAQSLDYASWIAEIEWEALDEVPQKHFGQTVAERYAERFGTIPNFDEAPEPRMIIIASELDEASERIARFLTNRGIAINALFFSVFQDGMEQLLTRSWLLNPQDAEQRTMQAGKKKFKHPSSGYWRVNVGDSIESGGPRSWLDNEKFGFMSADGDPVAKLRNIPVGAYVYAYLNDHGYVGLGEVILAAVPIAQFRRPDGSGLDVAPLEERGILNDSDDLDKCDYAIGVIWSRTFDSNNAVKALPSLPPVGTVCPLNQPEQLEALRRAFVPEAGG